MLDVDKQICSHSLLSHKETLELLKKNIKDQKCHTSMSNLAFSTPPFPTPFFPANMQSVNFKSTVWATYRKAYGV